MKRFIAAISLAMLAAPAFAADAGAPYEQLNVDRALPNLPERRSPVAASGATRSERQSASNVQGASNLHNGSNVAPNVNGGSIWATGPWANDHHFIAPAP